MINVTKSYLPPKEEFIREIESIWETAWLTNMGEKHDALKASLKDFLGVTGIELFANGHLALEMAIQGILGGSAGASDGKPREIITTPFSFASTTHAIVRQGFRPVFCDIREDDCTIDADRIEELITDRTAAILPVHVYGNICDVNRIEEIAKRHGLAVIYDAAHTFGETYDGKGIGTFGDASMFSFHATKVFHTIEGGCVTYADGKYDDILYQLKNFGIMDQENVEYVGGNAKLDEFRCAMGLCVLRHLPELIEQRRKIDAQYRDILSGREGIRFLKRDEKAQYNYAYMPVVFDGPFDRDAVFQALKAEGINARKYFYPCINAYACYREEYDAQKTPAAADISGKILTLPIYPGLAENEVERICGILLRTAGR